MNFNENCIVCNKTIWAHTTLEAKKCTKILEDK